MSDIGATLREARMRARIDVSEIEAKTKIRAKYLRALENEEFDLLPGPSYVKSFLRTYAQALGLDSRALLEEYRHQYEGPSEHDSQPIVPPTRRNRPGAPVPRGIPTGYVVGFAVLAVLIVLLLVGVLTGGSNNPPATPSASHTKPKPPPAHTHHTATPPPTHHRTRIALQLQPTAPVWVCLIGTGGKRLVSGVILQPGSPQPTYHARRFVMTLGNSSLTLKVDGHVETVPPSGAAIGYSLTKAGRHVLTATQLPKCA